MKRLLFVDPDRARLRCYGVLLKMRGYRTETTDSAAEAIALLEKETFDLAVVNESQAGRDGLIRALGARRVPVLLLATGSGTLWGADAALAFPFRPEQLFAAAKQLLTGSEQRKEGQ